MKQPKKHHHHHNHLQTKGEATTLLSKTRVCIKNLPSANNFSERDLRDFLLQQLPQAQITDCRILKQHAQHGNANNNKKNKSEKSRCMAFCGFEKESQAKLCVERLHKSYCRTARLVVEYAHLPTIRHEDNDNNKKNKESDDINKEEKGSAKDDTSKQSPSKEDDKVERKKKEFLAVMGVGDVSTASTTSKRKFWANDEDENQQQQLVPASQQEDNDISQQSDAESANDSDCNSSEDDDDDSVDDADPLQSSKVDDMDFLRSKQVQIEDLDEEVREETSGTENDNKDDSEDDASFSTDYGIRQEETIDSLQQQREQLSDAMEYQETPLRVNDNNELQAILQQEPNNRLFLRNLPFSAREEDIREHFEPFGAINECHIPVDDQGRSKGFGFVTFTNSADAKEALSELDGTDFQGRLLHVLPARPSKQLNPITGGLSSLSYKERMEQERKASAMSDTKGWSASFVRGDAVVDNLASRLGLNKGDIMAVKDGLSAGDAAVRLALGETAVIEENRKYFAEHGIDMEALVSGNDKKSEDINRSNTQILVKNLPHDTTKEELLKVFGASGGRDPKSIFLPPSRTIAVVEYGHGNDAKVVFRRLAYRRFKSVPLYLEWAPLAANVKSTEPAETEATEAETVEDEMAVVATSTLYVKNLNFQTTEEELEKLFSQHVKDVRSVRIPKKAVPTKRSRTGAETHLTEQLLSMGYGFVELGSSESARKALKLLNGTLLDGHILDIKPSGNKQGMQTVAADAKKSNCKLMVRNVPFQANRKELLQLFGSFGQLKRVRLPKKFDGTNRGFAFVEYLTGKEAASAMKTLSRTHLYGRHLVIEWAATDEESERLDGLREKAERDIMAAPKNKKIRFDYY